MINIKEDSWTALGGEKCKGLLKMMDAFCLGHIGSFIVMTKNPHLVDFRERSQVLTSFVTGCNG